MKTIVTRNTPEPAIQRGVLVETKAGKVVLVTEVIDHQRFAGTVVAPSEGESYGSLGYHSRGWTTHGFKPFHGTLTMEH
jgi:hypothetical protein